MEQIKLPQAAVLTSPNPVTVVCTEKPDGSTNLATVSWWTYLSFNPEMIAYAMAKRSTATRLRKLCLPGMVTPSSARPSEGRQVEITKETTMGEILEYDRGIAYILMQSGMHCVGCPSSIHESLEEACMVHGLEAGSVLQAIKDYVAAK